MLAVQIGLGVIGLLVIFLCVKLVKVEKRCNEIAVHSDFTSGPVYMEKMEKEEGIGDTELVSSEASTQSKYYAVCVCQKPNKQRSYFSFVTDNYIEGDPSSTDIANLRANVLAANSEFNSCEVIFITKIKD